MANGVQNQSLDILAIQLINYLNSTPQDATQLQATQKRERPS